MATIELPSTQRAYTLRLRAVADVNDDKKTINRKRRELNDVLWATHEAVSAGAKAFGDWLLTFRGGLSHDLAETPPHSKGTRGNGETTAHRKNRRILLALSWLSVEDDRGAPKHLVRIAKGTDTDTVRRGHIVAAFRDILSKRGLEMQSIDEWEADCADSLSSRIREDAAWINRSAAFDAASTEIGPSLTREEVWDLLEPFFGSREAYLASAELTDEGEDAEDKAKDLVQKAGQWLSSRFGTGQGADFASMAKVYQAMSDWADRPRAFRSGADALLDLGGALAPFKPASADAEGILSLISGPGYKSATRNLVKAWGDRTGPVSEQDVALFDEAAAGDEQKCKGNVGGKGRRPWSDKILAAVEAACGFTYLQQDGPARHSEFAVMLDHAARRVSIGHSWIKRAEAERRRFEEDAKRLHNVPPDAMNWLDGFIIERSGTSGAAAAGGEYRIRRRAIEGWDEIVNRWSRPSCKSEKDRLATAREVQADPEIDKFGDIQLFEALASDDAQCIWRQNAKATAEPLRDYVMGHDARFKQRRFKVPAYRHPDPLRHPVFCDFGNSRWEIEYAVHAAAKAVGSKRKPDSARAAWLKDRRGLRMGLWDGSAVRDIPMRWSSKRLTKDLALGSVGTGGSSRDVTRADRLGRAASGLRAGEVPSAAGLFALNDWNGRLQAPRAQLDAIAKRVDRCGWDGRARAMRDQLRWLVTFSAKLECRGPFMDYANGFGDNAPSKPFVSRKGELAVKHETNDKRHGQAKLILSRLPGLRVLSVDLGHRFAAACAVWQALSAAVFKDEITGKTIVAGGTGERDPYCQVATPTDKLAENGRNKGKPVAEITIYRRIGEDLLRDPKSGERTKASHPAPWARLDRQFLIKLQGEEAPPRAASQAEIDFVSRLESELGRTREKQNKLPRRVDELMSEAVGSLRLALLRHARRAKIAFALDPNITEILTVGGGKKPIARGDHDHIKLLTDALFDWHTLATERRWCDVPARDLWNQHIATIDVQWKIDLPEPASEMPDERTRQQRRKDDDAVRERFKPIAQALAQLDRTVVHAAWRDRWGKEDGDQAGAFKSVAVTDANGRQRSRTTVGKSATGLHAQLRQVTDWITGRRYPGADSQRASRGWRQNIGGLSLTRIATMRSLYQLHKAFAMRTKPDKPRGAPEKGETNAGVAQSLLDAMERMREQRVKQLASRIAAAALGLGGHWKTIERRDGKGNVLRDTDGPPRMKQVWVEDAEAKYPPCHAIVIESLRNYRPDELQTRRENRALMTWSSGKVRKYLEEACQLHGLHLREVMPNYTSRQCSRTGLPGLRCGDVPVSEFLSAPWWSRAINAAKEKIEDGSIDAEARFLVDLHTYWSNKPDSDRREKTIRVPRRGGDLFIAAPVPGSVCAAALHADLNAAANIGLRALLDPDFAGRWWFVPAALNNGWRIPAPNCAGAVCLTGWTVAPKDGYFSSDGTPLAAADDESVKLAEQAVAAAKAELDAIKKAARKNGGDPAVLNVLKRRHDQAKAALSEAKRAASQKEIVNIWQDPSAHREPVSAGRWRETSAYWNFVRTRVIDRLRAANGLDSGDHDRLAGVKAPR